MTPGWLAIFEDITTIQFNHRIFAYLLLAIIAFFSGRALRCDLDYNSKCGLYALWLLLLIQFALGISTLLLHVPVAIAAAHQGVAIALFTASLYLSQRLSAGAHS